MCLNFFPKKQDPFEKEIKNAIIKYLTRTDHMGSGILLKIDLHNKYCYISKQEKSTNYQEDGIIIFYKLWTIVHIDESDINLWVSDHNYSYLNNSENSQYKKYKKIILNELNKTHRIKNCKYVKYRRITYTGEWA